MERGLFQWKRPRFFHGKEGRSETLQTTTQELVVDSRGPYIFPLLLPSLSLSLSLSFFLSHSLLSLYGRRGVLNSVREVIHLRAHGTVPRLRAVTSRDSPLSLPGARDTKPREASERASERRHVMTWTATIRCSAHGPLTSRLADADESPERCRRRRRHGLQCRLTCVRPASTWFSYARGHFTPFISSLKLSVFPGEYLRTLALARYVCTYCCSEFDVLLVLMRISAY